MKTFREIAEMHYASEPTSTIDKIYKNNRIDALEKLLTEQLTIPIVMDCGTCKHRAVSKYVEPCYGCRDNDGYDNFESAIVL